MSNRSMPVVVEQTFPVSPQTLWAAITEHDQMVHWFFDNIPQFQPQPGFETRFNVVSGKRSFVHHWKILEVVPAQKIVYDWRYDNVPGIGTVTFEIIGETTGPSLRVTTNGLESFPVEVDEFSRENCQAGWDFLIRQQLKNYLANQSATSSS